MNLTTEPWIPIVWVNGKPALVSLRDAFARGHEIQDLAVRPHERIALMRLLICIAQAALDGPVDKEDWKDCLPRIAQATLDYLHRRHRSFELFGDNLRFLQAVNLKKPEGESIGEDKDLNSVGKLDLALATGNNTTLFDNTGGSERHITAERIALMLLTFQCFSPGGTIGVALWSGSPTFGWSRYPKPAPGQSGHAPCLAGATLHAFVRERNLLHTLRGNLMTRIQAEHFFGEGKWGMPVWEQMPEGPLDKAAISNAISTYLGRLVPLTRAIWLADDCRSMILANGLEYAPYPEWREPSATIVTRTIRGQTTRVVLSGSVERAPWRELHALTVKATSQTTNGGPAALEHISNEKTFDLWVGAFLANKAKPIDTTESVFCIPGAMLWDPAQNAYEKGVRLAENASYKVMRGVSVYHKELGDSLDRPEAKNRRRQIQYNAVSRFWTDIEMSVSLLMQVASGDTYPGTDDDWHNTSWGQAVWRAARAAYEHACHRETTRQIRAHALGLNAMFAASAENPQKETEEEVEV